MNVLLKHDDCSISCVGWPPCTIYRHMDLNCTNLCFILTKMFSPILLHVSFCRIASEHNFSSLKPVFLPSDCSPPINSPNWQLTDLTGHITIQLKIFQMLPINMTLSSRLERTNNPSVRYLEVKLHFNTSNTVFIMISIQIAQLSFIKFNSIKSALCKQFSIQQTIVLEPVLANMMQKR